MTQVRFNDEEVRDCRKQRGGKRRGGEERKGGKERDETVKIEKEKKRKCGGKKVMQ